MSSYVRFSFLSSLAGAPDYEREPREVRMTPVWYNVRKAAQVAAFFAKEQGGKINVLKLVKLIYLAHRESLKAFDAPILQDKFVSMDHGPVNSITLNFINGLIDEKDDWSEFITDRHGHFIALAKQSLNISDFDELSKADIKILKYIWERFGGMDGFQLAGYTHKHCPEWEDPHGSSTPIPIERVLKFLGKPAGVELARKIEAERLMDSIFAQAHELPPDEESDSSYAVRANE
jgi:uncharacterized phage-associated protein